MKIHPLFRRVLVPAILVWLAAFTAAADGATLVPAGSVWKYLDTGANLGTTWTSPLYDDSAWASGPAQLGYGEGDEATVVSYGGNPTVKYITTYFRHAFMVTNAQAYSNLTLRLLRDDGAVVYLNGWEVARVGMPAGTITYTTPATDCAIEGRLFVSRLAVLPGGLLVDGPNVVAVEIHQASRASSDISFDLELADEPMELTRILDLGTNATFAGPANLCLTAKAASQAGITNVKFYVNGVRQGDKSLFNNLYASFACTLDIPTNYSLAVAAIDKAGIATTSSVEVVVNPSPDAAQKVTLVGSGSEWKYLDDGSDQGSSWRQPEYTDDAWSAGAAPLGYGKPGAVTTVRGTRGNGTPITTTYFRRAWDVPDPSVFTQLAVRVLRDDGVKVFLNGAEVFRNNVPSDPVNAGTPALEATDATNFVSSASIDASLLVAGRNVLAAEVHQAAGGPADLMFDLELTGIKSAAPRLSIRPTATNTVLLAWPYPSTGFRLMENASLDTTNWTEVTATPEQVGDEYQTIVELSGGSRFYRLRNP